MKKILFTVAITAFCFIDVKAQDKGINFEKGMTWPQILAKAKTEKKFIFADCYGGDSAPSRKMDKDVYVNDTIGNFANAHYISVKMQMDTAAGDDVGVKMLYKQAHLMTLAYHVSIYPTFLFFNEDGKAVDKSAGAQGTKVFLQTLQNALDTGKQYYTLLNAWQNGKKDYARGPELALKAGQAGESEQSLQIARDYMHGYLDKLEEDAFLTETNIRFLVNYRAITTSNDRLFLLCLSNPDKVDTAMHVKGISSGWINYIVYKEELAALVDSAKKNGTAPDWGKISGHIAEKFGKQYVEGNITQAEIDWFGFKKDGPQYTKYLVRQTNTAFEKPGAINKNSSAIMSIVYNQVAWQVFSYDNDKQDLESAVNWEDKVLEINKSNGVFMDTKANLLYKLGKKDEAMALEKQAIALDPQNHDLAANYLRMLTGQPTWPAHM